MNKNDSLRMTPLDQMVSSESLQLLKAAIPYTPPDLQKFLSIWAKMQELSNALSLFPGSSGIQSMSVDTPKTSTADMLSDILQFASGETKKTLEQVSSALTAMQMFQSLQNDPISGAAVQETPDDGCTVQTEWKKGEEESK